jgi:hypothetical protein
MNQRLAARDLDQPRADFVAFFDQLIEALLLTAIKRILGVAPRAAQRTAGQPNERTRITRPGALALDRMKDLGNSQKFRH